MTFLPKILKKLDLNKKTFLLNKYANEAKHLVNIYYSFTSIIRLFLFYSC